MYLAYVFKFVDVVNVVILFTKWQYLRTVIMQILCNSEMTCFKQKKKWTK